MNEVNYKYLTEQLKNTGFGDVLNKELANRMSQGAVEFQLTHNKTFGKDNITATLHFKKGNHSDMYFFNRYQLQLMNNTSDVKAGQMFYINKGSSITLKEGYNLLEGRAVHKMLTDQKGEKYGAWLQLDFKNVAQTGNYEFKKLHDKYGFDLQATLAKYPIKDLQNAESKRELIRSLERGNLQSATFQFDGKEEKLFITANPEYMTLTSYNKTGQRASLPELFQKEEQTKKQKVKPEQKQVEKATRGMKKKDEKPAQKRSRKQKI